MSALRAVIVDDETPARERLARLLGKIEGLEIVGEARDGVMALRVIAELDPDVVFLDIEMPRLDGFGVAEALGTDAPAVIFVTAYDEHALRAFDASAVDYLVKPVLLERLSAAVDRVRLRVPAGDVRELLAGLGGARSRRLALKSGADFVIVDLDEVCVILAQDRYAVFKTISDEVLSDEPLDALAERLRDAGFLRVHRSAIVNVAWLASLEREGDRKYAAVLRDPQKTRVPVSRERLAELKAALGL